MAIDIGSLIVKGMNGAGGTAAPATSGGWGDVLEWLVPAGASLAGGWLSGQAGAQGANAQADAANASVGLSRDIYNDQRNLAKPGYMTGGNASNALAAIYGFAPQNYQAAYAGGGYGTGYGANPNAPSASNNWGAGQPVAGHTGGGGPNALAGGIGAGIGTAFGGPIGGAIGGALGGLVRNGGDNWTTLATGAPEGYDYDAYMNQNPGLAAEWAKKDVQSLFNGNRDAYAYWHYNQFGPSGKNEGWQLNPLEGYTVGPDGLPATGSTTGTTGSSGANALADPMKAFTDSPYGKIATSGFRGVDQPEVNALYSRGGKVLSGAQSIALDERGKARLGGAFNDYTNGLRSLAGMNQTASSQIGSAASQYGANAGNAMMAAGEAKGNALSSAYGGIAQGINGALGTVSDFGRKNWGWG